MKKNLDVDHYRNGDPIPEVKDSIEWVNLKTGAWCYFNNDPKNGAIYGKLYNWYAVSDPRGLAPIDWHVPSDDEWKELANHGGGEYYAAKILKEADTVHWEFQSKEVTNESGFSAFPGGMHKFIDGSFFGIGDYGYWWSSTMATAEAAWSRKMSYSNTFISRIHNYKGYGYSVRCVKD